MQFKVFATLLVLAISATALPGGEHHPKPQHPPPSHPPSHPGNSQGGGNLCGSSSVAYCCNSNGGSLISLGGLLNCGLFSSPCSNGDVFCCNNNNQQNGVVNVNAGNCVSSYSKLESMGVDPSLTKVLGRREIEDLLA